MSVWNIAAVGMGANQGDREANLNRAAAALRAFPECRNFRFSPLYETQAVDCFEPHPFLNAAVTFETRLRAEELLRNLHRVEDDFGRRRPYVNAPRPLDLDLLLYGETVIKEPHLTVPHPRMQQRLFVLTPLTACLGEDYRHPALNRSLGLLEAACKREENHPAVRFLRPPDWAAAPSR